MIENYDSVDVFIVVDVEKSEHQAVALNCSGNRLHDKALSTDPAKLRAVIRKLKLRGRAILVVDQPETVGALPVAYSYAYAYAYAVGTLVGYLPSLATRRFADLHAGEAETNARDAAIIAEAGPGASSCSAANPPLRRAGRRTVSALRIRRNEA